MKAIGLIIITLCFGTGFVGQAPNITLPVNGSADIDGRIDEKEWTDAKVFDLVDGGKLFLKYDGSYVYLGMRGAKAGWSHVYLNDGSTDVSVIHASAALGRSIYKQDAGKLWQPSNEFAWEVRERVVNDETRVKMNAYLAKNGWVGSNNNMGNAAEVEYKVAVKNAKSLRFAAVFMLDAAKPNYFPATLTDDTLKKTLLEGNTPRDLKFDVSKWATLRVRK